jgi:hypothetical protein
MKTRVLSALARRRAVGSLMLAQPAAALGRSTRQLGAEHADCHPHAGADQQPDQAAPERSADADEPGAQPGESRLQHRQPAALDAGDHRAPDCRGAGTGLRRAEHGSGPSPGCTRSSTPPPSAATRCYRDAQERWKNTLDGLHTAMRMQAQVSQNLAQDESVLADLVSQSQSADRRVAGHAGDQPASGLAGQAVHPGPAAPDHARPGGLAGTGAAGGGHRARPRSAAALPRHRHAVHAAVRQLLQQLRRPCDAFLSCWPCC